MNPEGTLPTVISSALEDDITEALSAALGSPATEWFAVQQVISGSRINFLVEVVAGAATEQLWCRATEKSTDDAFGERYTLGTETRVLHNLEQLGVQVPTVLATSTSERVIVQRYIARAVDVDDTAAVARYMGALDAVHALDPDQVIPDAGGHFGDAALAAAIEHGRWSGVAARVLENPEHNDAVATHPGLEGLTGRVRRIVEGIAQRPPPRWDERSALVHGDAGRENFIVGTDGLLWLIDWELAHAGSRMEDYAWCEVRGLEELSAAWLHEIVSRVRAFGAVGASLYNYFRMLIYFRSAIAIAARVVAEPNSTFVPYLTRRLVENERLGWLSANEFRSDPHTVVDIEPITADPYGLHDGTNKRLSEWHTWTAALRGQ